MKTSIQIKKPCHQDFQTFEKTKSGAYCNSCKKEIIDFTTMTPTDVLKKVRSKSQHLCGRFKKSQIDGLTNFQQTFKFTKKMGLAAVTLMTIAITPELKAQNAETVSKAEQTQSVYQVQGQVLDDNGEPLPGANIVLKGSTIGAVSDLDGKFKFPKELKEGDVLQFSYIGFEPKEYDITSSETKTIDITLNFETSDIFLMGEVYIDKPYSSKSKRYKSIFQK